MSGGYPYPFGRPRCVLPNSLNNIKDAIPRQPHGFEHSCSVMDRRAAQLSRTAPRRSENSLEYIDRSISILGATCESLDRQQSNESHFLVAHFHEIDTQFAQLERRFDSLDERVQQPIGRSNDIEAEVHNMKALFKNERLNRLQSPITPIKVLKNTTPAEGTGVREWSVHDQVPRHMKDAYILGQRAKGIFDPHWDYTRPNQEAAAMQEAQHKILSMVRFYDIPVIAEHENQTEAIELDLNIWTVDYYMDMLLDHWGLDWRKVVALVERHQQLTSGTKREAPGDPAYEEASKRVRRETGDVFQ